MMGQSATWRRLTIAAIAVTVALAGYVLGRYVQTSSATADQAGGQRVPAVSLIRLNGQVESLQAYAGKTLVINIWATWCAPCRRELPSLQELSSRLDPERFAIIGISIDTEADFVSEYLKDAGIHFANYIDSSQVIAKELLDMPAVPTTVIVRPDGRIFRRIIGERRWDSPQVIQELADVAAGRV